MNLPQMHSWFRQYAQQMGMQNTRAILPEQIDMLINTSTNDIIDEVIGRNIGQNNDRIITDNVRINNINALKTMYRNYVMEVNDNKTLSVYDDGKISYKFSSKDLPDYRYIIDFSVRYSRNPIEQKAYVIAVADEVTATDVTIQNWLNANHNGANVGDYIISKHTDNTVGGNIYIVKSINNEGNYTVEYLKPTITSYYNTSGLPKVFKVGDKIYTLTNPDENVYTWVITNFVPTYSRWFPIRIIDDIYFADALNDFVLAPRARSPILVTYGSTSFNGGIFVDNDEQTFDIYFGETSSENVINDLYIAEIRCSYIKSPAKVKYLSDVADSNQNINSDLPEQLQIPMLKHAVDLYRLSIQGSMFANQQNAQVQQQELARNNQRPANEDYQS